MRMGGSAEGKAGFISLRRDCHCVVPRREGKKKKKKKEKKKERKKKKKKKKRKKKKKKPPAHTLTHQYHLRV